MKKVIFAVLAALVMSVSFSSCSKSKADQMIDEMEQLVEKYGDLKEEDFTADQKKKIEELMKRFE